MKKYLLFLSSLTILSIVTTTLAFSQEEPIVLDEVEISSMRNEQLLKNSPELVRVITSTEIKSLNVTDVSDILDYVAGVNIETGTGSGFANRGIVAMNGMPAQYTLVLLNGNRILSDHIHSGQNINFIPVEEIERIEIIKTASSAQYGSDAIAGVVNIITKTAETKSAASFFGEYGSYNTYNTGASVQSMINEKTGIYTLVNYKESDGVPLIAPAHRIGKMGYNSLNLTQRLTTNLGSSLKLDAWVKYINSNMQFRDEMNESYMLMPNLSLKYTINNKSYITTKLAFSRWNSETSSENNEVFRPEVFYTLKLSDDNNLIAGTDLSVHSFTRSAVDLHIQRMIGVFVQDEHKFNDKLAVLGSVRMDKLQSSSMVLTPKFAIMYNLNQDLKIRASVSRGYHAPSVQELYEVGYGHGGTAYRFGNPDLKPEYSTSVGLGLDYSKNNKLFVNLSGFYSNITNMIVPVYSGPWEQDTTKDVWMRKNILEAQIISAEISASWYITNNYNLLLSYNYADNIAKSEISQQLPYKPGQSFNARFTAKQNIGNKIIISEFISLRSVFGRSAWNWKPESGTDTTNPFGLTTELADYQKLDAGINLCFAKKYNIYFNVGNILGQDIENLDDAYTIIDGEPIYKLGIKINLY
ncbi:MAG: TonB-dependent receptor [Bacteroidales bacterium]|nr:TonB-dependent receptor [Bacteroidales bacterium]